MPQFDINTYPSQIFWLLLTFGILYFIISNFIIPKAESIIKNREIFISRYIEDAHNNANAIENLNKEYNSILESINNEVEKINQKYNEDLKILNIIQYSELSEYIEQEKLNINKELKKIESDFAKDKENISKKLASIIINKVIQDPVDLQILSECYKNIK